MKFRAFLTLFGITGAGSFFSILLRLIKKTENAGFWSNYAAFMRKLHYAA